MKGDRGVSENFVASRARIYCFLAKVFGRGPDAELWAMLQQGALAELSQAVERPWRYEGTLQDLRREFAAMDRTREAAFRSGAGRLQRLSSLCNGEVQAWDRGDREAICGYLEKERELLRGEVKTFGEELWNRRPTSAEKGFYDIVTELALEYLEAEQDGIDLWVLESELAASEAFAI